MKRPGFLLAEALLALGLTAALAAAAFPAIAKLAGAVTERERRLHASETAFFACDYITDKIRQSRRRSPTDAVSDSRCIIAAHAEDGKLRPYTFLVEDRVWKLKLYTGRKQPLTGDEEGIHYDVVPFEGLPYFRQTPGGPVQLAYRMQPQGIKGCYDIRTAILPLADFFRMGEPYE